MTLQETIDAIVRVIEEPTSNLAAAALLAAAATLVVLILVLGLLAILLRPSGRTEEPEAGEGEYGDTPAPITRGGRSWPRRVTTLVTLALVVGAFVVAGYATASDVFCAEGCHAEGAEAPVLRTGSHEVVACVACHEDGSLAGLPGDLVARATHAVFGSGLGATSGYLDDVSSSRCLACHDDVLRPTEDAGDTPLRMSHAEPAEAGMTCTECHAGAGHADEAFTEDMSVCIHCHDGVQASTECDTCHVEDPTTYAMLDSRRQYPVTDLGPVDDCGGCHDQTSCDGCHGVRMPHTDTFIRSEHARYAAFERKAVCWRCHREIMCAECHDINVWSRAHGVGFKARHSDYPWDSDCSQCHTGHTGSFCVVCHPGRRP